MGISMLPSHPQYLQSEDSSNRFTSSNLQQLQTEISKVFVGAYSMNVNNNYVYNTQLDNVTNSSPSIYSYASVTEPIGSTIAQIDQIDALYSFPDTFTKSTSFGFELVPAQACRPPVDECDPSSDTYDNITQSRSQSNENRDPCLENLNSAISAAPSPSLSATFDNNLVGSTVSSPLSSMSSRRGSTSISQSVSRSDEYSSPKARSPLSKYGNPSVLKRDFKGDSSSSSSSCSSPRQSATHKVCTVCGKCITRDMSRHLRTHEAISRFRCIYPRETCIHKTGQFNRPYDFKKHLLNCHFKFDDCEDKKLHNLSDKLPCYGTCYCGQRFKAEDWLDNHILRENGDDFECPYLKSYYERTGVRPPAQVFTTK